MALEKFAGLLSRPEFESVGRAFARLGSDLHLSRPPRGCFTRAASGPLSSSRPATGWATTVFCNYVTAAIFPEHLKFCERPPQVVVNLFQGLVLDGVAQDRVNGQSNKSTARQRRLPNHRNGLPKAESQGKWSGQSFFEARPDNCGSYDRGFPLRSLISQEIPFPEVLRCPPTIRLSSPPSTQQSRQRR